MTYGNAAVQYREREVLTASPAKLVVIIYDHLLASLYRAKYSIQAQKIEARIEAIGKARDAVVELLASTDIERGGQLAHDLRALYAFMFNELNEIVAAPEVARVDRLFSIVAQLSEGFATIAANSAIESPAA